MKVEVFRGTVTVEKHREVNQGYIISIEPGEGKGWRLVATVEAGSLQSVFGAANVLVTNSD